MPIFLGLCTFRLLTISNMVNLLALLVLPLCWVQGEDVFELPPGAPTLVLSSSSATGEHLGHALGAYMKVSMLEGAPLYEQMQEDGQGCILSREDAHWVVRAAAGQGDALLRAPYENTPSVPSSGWAFLDSKLQVWAEDATMTAAPADLACGGVTLALGAMGGAVEAVGGAEGAYAPMPGFWSAGRPIFQQTEGGAHVLGVAPNSSQWTVRVAAAGEPLGGAALLASASAGALCPCTGAGWGESEGEVEVTCEAGSEEEEEVEEEEDEEEVEEEMEEEEEEEEEVDEEMEDGEEEEEVGYVVGHQRAAL